MRTEEEFLHRLCGTNQIRGNDQALTRLHPSEGDIKEMNAVLSSSVRKGQSVTTISSAQEDTFKGYRRSAVYGWIEASLFSANGHSLPYAGISRKRSRSPFLGRKISSSIRPQA